MIKVGIRIDEDREPERPLKPFTEEDVKLVISSLESELTSDYLGKFFRPNENIYVNLKITF